MAPVDPDVRAQIETCWQLGWRGQSSSALAVARGLVVAAEDSGDDSAIAAAKASVAWFCLQLGQADEGLELAHAAMTAFSALQDREGEAFSTALYSWLLLELGLGDLAFEHGERAVAICEAVENGKVRAFALTCKSMALIMCRQDQLAGPLAEEALRTAKEAGEFGLATLGLVNLGYSSMSLAEEAEAAGKADESLALRRQGMALNDQAIATARANGDLWNLRLALCNGAEGYADLGETDTAARYLEDWEGLPRSIGVREQVHYLYTKSTVLMRSGAFSAALPVCEAALVLARSGSHLDNRANAVRRLSEVEAALGLFAPALEHFREYHAVFVLQMGEMTRRRAQVVEMQLQNQRLVARAAALESEAMRDPLTGLGNRRAFEADLERRAGMAFCLAILDLDHFKQVNDRFGHLTGDAVLQYVAGLIGARGEAVRAYRLGGEEFALLLRTGDDALAGAQLDTIRQEIERYNWSDLEPQLQVTASIGFACSLAWQGRALIAEADRRLYAAKSLGRNRVVGLLPNRLVPLAAEA